MIIDRMTPVTFHFGNDSRKELSKYLDENSIIICSKRGRKQIENDSALTEILKNQKLIWIDSVKESPSISDIQEQIDFASKQKFNNIIAFGGGSVIDSAKAISISKSFDANIDVYKLILNPNILENHDLIPILAIPTTSGTGAEMTPFATLWDYKNKKKYSLDNKKFFPVVSFIDPVLTYELPLKITLSTGLDAINQAFESIWNVNANDTTLELSYKSLELGLVSLKRIMQSKTNDKNARKDLAECSMLAGIAISHTRTAICHSISYPLTAHFNVPHGIACAFTMRKILKKNIEVDDGRFTTLAKRLLGHSYKSKDLIDYLQSYFVELEILSEFKKYANNLNQIKNLKNEMFTKERAKNSLVKISLDDIDEILEESFKDE